MQRDRLLMLVPAMPAERGNGLAMRLGFFLSAYATRFDVDLVVVPVAGDARRPDSFVQSHACRVHVVTLDQPDTHYALLAALRDRRDRLEAFRTYGRPSLACFTGTAERAIGPFTHNVRYAAVHVSRLYLAELARRWTNFRQHRCAVVLDCDDDDAAAYRSLSVIARRSGNPFAASWAELEAIAFARMAKGWLSRFDLAFTASDKETRALSLQGGRGVTIPNVINVPIMKARRGGCGRVPTLVFVGTLGYAPNADAITWFVSRVWRRLQRVLNFRVRLVIIGRHPPGMVMRLRAQRGIELAANVPDVAPLYGDADLAIAPLRAGGGTRIKVIEAAAHGVPVVATRLAAQGTTFRSGAEMLIADDAATFLRACLALLRNGSLAARLAEQARRKARRDYSVRHWTKLVASRVACGNNESWSAEGAIDVGTGGAGEQPRSSRGS